MVRSISYLESQNIERQNRCVDLCMCVHPDVKRGGMENARTRVVSIRKSEKNYYCTHNQTPSAYLPQPPRSYRLAGRPLLYSTGGANEALPGARSISASQGSNLHMAKSG